MVKTNPRIQDRAQKRKRRLLQTLINPLKRRSPTSPPSPTPTPTTTPSPSPSPPFSSPSPTTFALYLPAKRETQTQKTETMVKTNPTRFQDSKQRRKRRLFQILTNPLKRQSPSPSSPSSPSPSPSPPFSESTKPTSNGNNISCPLITQSQSGQPSFLDTKIPKGPEFPLASRSPMGQLPPLPPPPSKQLLRRTVSDPVPFSFATPTKNAPLSVSPSSLVSGSINDKSSNSKRMRRTSKKMGQMKKKKMLDENGHGHGHGSVSQSNNTCNCCLNNDDDDEGDNRKVRERAVVAERLAGNWIMIKISCPCGSDYQILVSEVDKKCYYKIV